VNHEPEPDETELDETPSDKQLTHDIDEALAKVRPERYDAGDKDWMDDVVESVRQSLADRAEDEVIRDAARRRVYRREAEATKRTNRLLRDIDETGQLPLGWGDGDKWRELLFDLLHLPLSIARRRVRFGVASANDLEQWELESGREEDKRHAAQISARRAARLLAKWLVEQNAECVEYLAGDGSAS
jgi:hypothetical protein